MRKHRVNDAGEKIRTRRHHGGKLRKLRPGAKWKRAKRLAGETTSREYWAEHGLDCLPTRAINLIGDHLLRLGGGEEIEEGEASGGGEGGCV